jgi:hypothetical protein
MKTNKKPTSKHWSQFPRELNDAPWTTLATLGVYSALAYWADFSNPKQGARPSHQQIAERCKASVKTVKRELNRLREHGAISWVSGGATGSPTGGRRANKYVLHIAGAGGLKGHHDPTTVGHHDPTSGGHHDPSTERQLTERHLQRSIGVKSAHGGRHIDKPEHPGDF